MSQEIQRHITGIYNELDQYHDNKGLTEICYWYSCKHFKYNEAFQAAFDQFDAKKIARYNDKKLAKLLANPSIVRNKLKIESSVLNAKAFLKTQAEFGSFDKYIWQFVDGKPLVNRWKSFQEVPARTSESDAMSKDLLKRGFKFVGSTICYAFMQATGMVNDHTTDCFRYKELK